MSEPLQIDGSIGEGGGQILRSSLALALHLQRPVHLLNIRRNRHPPGLRRQHLTCVLAAAEISQAAVSGAAIGSMELRFSPGPLHPGSYVFDIGTAGSTTLLLQTLLPPLLLAQNPSHLTLKGGTHNPFAPSFDFLQQVLLPQLQRMGATIRLDLIRPGFYPKGGGIIEVEIQPVPRLSSLELTERGEVLALEASAIVANLPGQIAERELSVLRQRLGIPYHQTKSVTIHGCGIGNVLTVTIRCRAMTELFTGFGERGKPAEKVANELADEVENYLSANVPVGPYLADQLLIPMALAGRGCFLTLTPSHHTLTNIRVIENFLPLKFKVARQTRSKWEIRLTHQ